MLEYRYFSTERAITYSQSGSIYSVIGDMSVRRKELSYVCRLASWSILSENRSPVIKLSHIPHFTTLQKFTERISGTLLGKIISSFIILTKIGQLFIGIDSSGFKATHASQYYTERAKLTRRRRKYIKLSLTADVVQQIICTIKIRRAPTRHDIIFSTTHNKDIRNLTIVSGYRWQGICMIAKTITY